MHDDNFRLALMSIRELRGSQRATEAALEETQAALSRVLEGQRETGRRTDQLIVALETVGQTSAETQQRLASLEARVDTLEEAS